MDWRDAIREWRSLPPAEKQHRRWARIPYSVAESIAFAGEPVSLELLEAEHSRRPVPSSSVKPISES